MTKVIIGTQHISNIFFSAEHLRWVMCSFSGKLNHSLCFMVMKDYKEDRLIFIHERAKLLRLLYSVHLQRH